MPLITRMLKQRAVYWPHVKDDASGQPVFGPPVEIKCRWEDVHIQFVDRTGTDQVSNSRVYTDRDVTLGGQLWLGKMSSLVSQTDPYKNPGAYAIRGFDKLPNLSAKLYVRVALL